MSSGCCVQCAKDRATAQYEARKEHILAYQRERYARLADKIKGDVRARRLSNPAQAKARRKADYDKNRDRYRADASAWAKENAARQRETQRAWRAANPHKVNHQAAMYHALRLKRRPPWLTKAHRSAIRAVYREARRLTQDTGIQHHVDHIVPLRGRDVSGLHVPWNLQVLTAKENITKSNRLDAAAA